MLKYKDILAKKGKLILVFALIFVLTSALFIGKVANIDSNASKPVGVTYQGYVQKIGWQNWVSDSNLAGTNGQSLRIEGLKIKLTNAPANAKITYQAHVQNIGWQNWVSNGSLIGTTGKNLRIEAIRVKLENMPGYTVQYQTHVQNVGWQDWVSDGDIAGTSGQSLRVEGIRIRIVPVTVGVTYQGHVQNVGWQDWVSNLGIAGTSGKGLRVEALKIKLTNAPANARIKYQAHVQNVGWQNWVYDGNLAGTSGRGLRVEAIKIVLENMPGYTVQYQAHVQNIGWQPWVSDGDIAGTSGQSLRIEAIRIRIVPKSDSPSQGLTGYTGKLIAKKLADYKWTPWYNGYEWNRFGKNGADTGRLGAINMPLKNNKDVILTLQGYSSEFSSAIKNTVKLILPTQGDYFYNYISNTDIQNGQTMDLDNRHISFMVDSLGNIEITFSPIQ